MIQQEIQERSEAIATMLSWTEEQPGSWFKTDKFAKYVVYSEHQNYPNKGLPFFRDWNCLMEAKKFICGLEKVDEFETLYDSVAKGYRCIITPAYKNSFETLYTEVFEEEIEAVFEIVSDFAKLYNINQI